MDTSYKEKYKDPHWQKVRLQVFERDGWKCRFCNEKKNTLQVHHTYYENGLDPWEYPLESLITLCGECHESETECLYDITKSFILTLRKLGFVGSDFMAIEVFYENLKTQFSTDQEYKDFILDSSWIVGIEEYKEIILKTRNITKKLKKDMDSFMKGKHEPK